MEVLNKSNKTAVKIIAELDKETGGIGLIERKRQGLGKPNIIYVKDLYSLILSSKLPQAKEFKKLLFEDFDLINFISILLFDDEELTKKVLGLNKNEKYLQKIRADSIQNFTMNFEIFITNVQGANKIKDFTRDEYIKSINYFEKIYGSYTIDDFYSFYKKALQEMEISHNTGL